jgi:Cu+-exporting ATPase
MENTTFGVPSITCNVCSGKIKDGLNGLEGIQSVNVDVMSKTVSVDYNPSQTSPQEIRKKVSSMGYEVTQ